MMVATSFWNYWTEMDRELLLLDDLAFQLHCFTCNALEWDGCDGISGLADDICKDSPSPEVSIFASPPIISVTVGITFGNLGKVFEIWILWIRGVAGRQIPPQSTLQLLTSDLSMNNFVLMHLGHPRTSTQTSSNVSPNEITSKQQPAYGTIWKWWCLGLRFGCV